MPPHRGNTPYGSIATLTGVATTLRAYISTLYLTGIATDRAIGCNGDASVCGMRYPDRGTTSVTAGERSRKASATRGQRAPAKNYPEVGST